MRLPIDTVLPRVVAALRAAPAAVLRAPTGAGKTTRVPGALLDAGLAGDGLVLMVEPRRLAARAAAQRIALERGGDVGGEVGYHVRFDRRHGPATRLLVATEGVLLRMLADDPFLERAGAVVFDEFHERNLDSDLALALLRRVQREVRPALKLVVMSATADTGPVAEFLGGCPVVESGGFLHPVAVEHLPRPAIHDAPAAAAAAARQALDRTPGDVLVFLPGVGEIRRAKRALDGVHAVELYGDLPASRQDEALRKGTRRRVVLATNVAETSVTVEGVTAVVDTGLARIARFDPGAGLPRLQVERISRAAAEQRKGRAGRETPGLCLRLWPEYEHQRLHEHDEPEVRRTDLAGAALQLLAGGEPDLDAFPWFEAPGPPRLRAAETLLALLGATADGRVTKLGRAMARLPVHPRLARLLLEGRRLGHPRRAALAAALLSDRDPFPRGPAAHRSDSDVLDRVEAVEKGRVKARFAERARDQLARLVAKGAPAPATDPDDAVLRAVFAAFPDRLCRSRGPGTRRALMMGGAGGRLAEECALDDAADLFVAVAIDARPGDALIRMASRVEREWLDRVTTEDDVEFLDGRVAGVRRTRFGDLVLEEVAVPPDPERAAEMLAAEAARDPARALPLEEPAVASFLARVRSLREWMPDLGLPAFDDLGALLSALCRGRRSFEELRKAPLLDHLRGALSFEQLRALDRHAPERIEAPSGSRIALRYEPGRPPVMPVRIQEMFGLAETPRVAGGRVPVLLHLLAPNRRPQQVTDDLASFWQNTYPVVRKELRARYPKHAWPEDPRTAPPERRPRRRR